MSLQIYQQNTGFLVVGNTEIPLATAEWTYHENELDCYITIKNGSEAVASGVALRHITDNNGNKYSSMQDWINWWSTLSTGIVDAIKTYRIPQEEITGTQDTFEIPEMINKSLPYWVVNGQFTIHPVDGITSVVNSNGTAIITFTEAIPEGNIAVLFYYKTTIED